MKTLIYDIETTPFDSNSYAKDRTVDRVWCIVCRDFETGEMWHYDGGSIEKFTKLLTEYDVVVGHNIIGFDNPVLERLINADFSKVVLRDTMVMSSLVYTNMLQMDLRIACRNGSLPTELAGKHSLKSWGYRLGLHKGEYNDFTKYCPEMLEYCYRDVEVTAKLYELLCKRTADMPMAVEWEHKFAKCIWLMCRDGVMIDFDKAREVLEMFQAKKAEIEAQSIGVFPPRVVPPESEGILPKNKYWNPKQCKLKTKEYPLNLNSSNQMIWFLNDKYGWEPERYTDKGNPQLTQDILANLKYPEAAVIREYMILDDRISTLIGKSGYMTLTKDDGRVHGTVLHCGAATHRCTHSKPNTANPTSVRSPYGKELRSVFSVPTGYSLVGADAAGLELRMLGEVLWDLDNGAYSRAAVSGRKEDGTDPHSINQRAFESESRDAAKTQFYAMLYGAGNKRMGAALEPLNEVWSKSKCEAVGAAAKAKYFKNLPLMAKVMKDHKRLYTSGTYMVGLDGRRAEVFSSHQALNTRLQMNGAIVVKYATVLAYEKCIAKGWTYGKDGDVCMVLHVHDEMQWQVRNELVPEMEEILRSSFAEAGLILGLRTPIAADVSVGRNWTETH